MVLSSDIVQRVEAVWFLEEWFVCLEDKRAAWSDLYGLAQDEDGIVRRSATVALGSVLGQVQDKNQAWKDLQKLTKDEDSEVRSSAASALGSAFGRSRPE